MSLCGFRKLLLSLVNTTETVSCFHSSTTMISGTSSPPSPCLDPSWYNQALTIQYTWTVTSWCSNLSPPPLLGPPHPGWWPWHCPERQNLCLLNSFFISDELSTSLFLFIQSTVSLFLPGCWHQELLCLSPPITRGLQALLQQYGQMCQSRATTMIIDAEVLCPFAATIKC